jgi:hypothetical protein
MVCDTDADLAQLQSQSQPGSAAQAANFFGAFLPDLKHGSGIGDGVDGGPSSARTRQREKAAATGGTQRGESTRVLAAIPSSSLHAEPANYCELCRWLKA